MENDPDQQRDPPIEEDLDQEMEDENEGEEANNDDDDDDDDDDIEQIETAEWEVINNDPNRLVFNVSGLNGIESLQLLGECLAPNTHLEILKLNFEVGGRGATDEQQRSWDSACDGIYEFLETSPSLLQLEVSSLRGFPNVVDKFLYRIAGRTVRNSSLHVVEIVNLGNCDFSPSALAYLLCRGRTEHLTLSSDHPTIFTQFTGPQDWQVAQQALAENTSLTSLSLSSNFRFLLDLPLENKCKINILHIHGQGVEIHDNCHEHIIQFLQNARHLREVRFWGFLVESEFEPFALGLARNECTVSRLMLWDNPLDGGGSSLLKKLLQQTSSIQELILTGGHSSLFNDVLQGLWGNRSVQRARFAWLFDRTNTDADAAVKFRQRLSQLLRFEHPTLQRLGFMQIDPSCAAALFQALAGNTTLTRLTVRLEGPIEDDVALEIKRCFQSNTSLKEFTWISKVSRISALRIFCDSLKGTQARTFLTLEMSDRDQLLCDEFFRLVTGLIEGSQSLAQLAVNCPRLDNYAAALFRAVEQNHTLDTLELKELSPTDMNWDVLIDCFIASLPRIMSLKHFNMSIDPDIILHRQVEILKALSCNYSLESLFDSDRLIGEQPLDGVFPEEFKCVLHRNKSLREFVVRTGSSPDYVESPPGLLARVLAMGSQQPGSVPVRYEVLRRNVHALPLPPPPQTPPQTSTFID